MVERYTLGMCESWRELDGSVCSEDPSVCSQPMHHRECLAKTEPDQLSEISTSSATHDSSI